MLLDRGEATHSSTCITDIVDRAVCGGVYFIVLVRNSMYCWSE